MGQNQSFRVSQQKKTFFQKKNARLAREKEKKESKRVTSTLGPGAKEQPNKANKQVIHTHIYIYIYSDAE